MAFYSPTWVRRLVKEDHENIQKYLLDSAQNDFRDYIDANTPFVLWLDIGLIRERILNKPESLKLIQELAASVSAERDVTEEVAELLDKAYVETINAYATNPAYIKITDTKLEEILSNLTSAPIGSIKKSIQDNFKKTMVVTNVTKKNKSVMLILPKFTTLRFGEVFKECLEKVVSKTKLLRSAPPAAIGGMFGQLAGSTSSDESEKSRMLAFVAGNFKKLQNIGHVEVDVVSEVDRKIMRAQNSPRLLQALVSVPKNNTAAFQRLQLKFSKETGQANSRIKVRKRFSGSKLVFELLVEHGLAVGIPETQKENLDKAKLERAFTIGGGLSATLRKDISILANLETSKSAVGFLRENLISIFENGKQIPQYTKNTDIVETSRVRYTKVKIANTTKSTNTSLSVPVRGTDRKRENLPDITSLQILLDANLVERVKENMGSGSSKSVLNLRSGRFAESAKVTKISASRAGMITAYYTYMKNPYATFSEGGEQQYPRSRDPKLLISKSIREIAAKAMFDRLRAVVV